MSTPGPCLAFGLLVSCLQVKFLIFFVHSCHGIRFTFANQKIFFNFIRSCRFSSIRYYRWIFTVQIIGRVASTWTCTFAIHSNVPTANTPTCTVKMDIVLLFHIINYVFCLLNDVACIKIQKFINKKSVKNEKETWLVFNRWKYRVIQFQFNIKVDEIIIRNLSVLDNVKKPAT